MPHIILKSVVLLLILTLCTAIYAAEPQASFLHDGDRWLFLGDSITHNDTYRSLIERMLKHFHPEATFMLGNMGLNGATSARDEGKGEVKPTVVSIMYGMNNSINSGWRYGKPMDADLKAFRADMTAKAREYKAMGAAVILMTPTLTDESYNSGIYELKGTREFLRQCGQIVREIAEQEGVYWLPVQEELEAYQNTLASEQILRLDGVHPSALGQYQIARTFCEHLNLAGPLIGKTRTLLQPPAPVPATVRLAARFLPTGQHSLSLLLASETPQTVTATWSLKSARGTETLHLTKEEQSWTPAIPAEALQLPAGESDQLILDLAAGDKRSLYVLDLCNTRVIHLTDGKAAGSIAGEGGAHVADWALERVDKGLLFSGEVTSKLNHPDEFWPWARDGVNLWLDFRPTARFADIGVDADVHMAIMTVRRQPRFSGSLIPWLGQGMQHAAEYGAEPTPTGYRWHLYVHNYFVKNKPVDFTNSDFIGMNIIIVDDSKYAMAQQTRIPNDKFANTLMVVDLKNKLPGEQVINLHLVGR